MKFKKKLTCIIIFLILYTVISEKYDLYYMDSEEKKLEMKATLAGSNTEVKKVELIKVGWEFITEEKDTEGEGKEINTKLSLILNGNKEEKILIGTYPGEGFEINDPKLYVLPQDSVITCEIFSHGLFNDFSVTCDNANIIIKRRTSDKFNENGENETGELDDYGFSIFKKIHYDNDFIIIKLKE